MCKDSIVCLQKNSMIQNLLFFFVDGNKPTVVSNIIKTTVTLLERGLQGSMLQLNTWDNEIITNILFLKGNWRQHLMDFQILSGITLLIQTTNYFPPPVILKINNYFFRQRV